MFKLTRLRWMLLAMLIAAGFGTAFGQDDPLAAGRVQFLSAYAAASASAGSPVDDGAVLKAYPLYPYLLAARIQWALSRPAAQVPADVDTRAAALLKLLGDQPLARTLRHDWLASLAARHDWARLLAEYRDLGDATLACDSLIARATLDRQKNLAADITQAWLNGRNTPDACEPAFSWLRAHDGLPPSLIDQRARLALQAGNSKLARKLADTLPPGLAVPIRQWATLIETPKIEIDALIAAPARPVESAALLDGWSRLSRSDPQGAVDRYQPLLDARSLATPAQAAPYARALGLGLAWSRLPQAGDYLQRVDAAAADDLSREWQARVALWAGDWPLAARLITLMPHPAGAALPRWQYWLARADEKAGDEDAARTLYAEVALSDNYYALLAAAHLGHSFAPHSQALAQNPVQQAQIAARPAFVRAHELWLCKLETLANAEWANGIDDLDPALRAQAAALALHWGWYDTGIATASKQAIYNDYALLYPRPFGAQVHAAAQAADLPDDLIYGLLRQESLYDTNAASPANAYGLMQLVLPTARAIAKHWQLPSPTNREDLFDPAINLPLGSAELRDRLDQFGGQVPVALAAYNAGPNAAARWLPPAPMDADIWIENIPYNETRGYVQRVLWHRAVFAWRRSGEAQASKDLLAPVTPLATATPSSPAGPDSPASSPTSEPAPVSADDAQ